MATATGLRSSIIRTRKLPRLFCAIMGLLLISLFWLWPVANGHDSINSRHAALIAPHIENMSLGRGCEKQNSRPRHEIRELHALVQGHEGYPYASFGMQR
jgi:hypothetical protein